MELHSSTLKIPLRDLPLIVVIVVEQRQSIKNFDSEIFRYHIDKGLRLEACL